MPVRDGDFGDAVLRQVPNKPMPYAPRMRWLQRILAVPRHSAPLQLHSLENAL